MTQSAKQAAKTESVLFPDVFRKEVRVHFDAPNQSSDGGALLIGGLDHTLGLCARIVAAIRDDRQIGKIDHTLREMIEQRIYMLVSGYDDLNDAQKLRADPVFKFMCAAAEGELASTSTLCRLENSVTARDLYRIGESLLEWQLKHQRRIRNQKPRIVTIDVDPTDDPTHGQQEFACFNGHYDTYCYLPLLASLTFHDHWGNEEPEQYLCAAILRPGNAAASEGARGLLRRIFRKLHETYPGIVIRVRLDGGFATPQMFDFLEEQNVKYLVNMGRNSVLKTQAEALMEKARTCSKNSGQSERFYGECYYAAGTWSKKRRVIIKAEVTRCDGSEAKDNPRFVVTNMSGDAEGLYRFTYCQRGDMENRIKELHAVGLGRTSCNSFLANQLRVFLAAAAYMLLQELRRRLKGTALARAQVWRLRESLLKLGASVREVTRKLYVSLPDSAPYAHLWCVLARGLSPVRVQT
jgi:hypothetical protein